MAKKSFESPIYQQFISYRPHQSASYARCIYPQRSAPRALNSGYSRTSLANQTATARKLKTALNWMLLLCPRQYVYSKELNKTFSFRLAFITLTLPSQQKHSDQYLNANLLQPFLRVLKNKCKLTHYIWKAEAQSNGNIHYHIISNVFIHYKLLRHYWNIKLNKLKYFADTKFHDSIFEANTTDVHSVYQVKSLAAYLSKYLTKSANLCNHVSVCTGTTNELPFIPIYQYLQDLKGCYWQTRRLILSKSFGVSAEIPTSGIIYEEGTESFNRVYQWLLSNTIKKIQPNDYVTIYTHDPAKSYNSLIRQ